MIFPRFLSIPPPLKMGSLPYESKPIKSIVITGGTHGNETNGIILARYFESLLNCNKSFSSDRIWKNYSSIESLKVVYGNPKAMDQNTRYVDEDLNRCFLKNDLNLYKDGNICNYERNRAAELNELLGPKGSPESVDLIIDIHTTTSNTKVNMIMSPFDEVSQQIGAYLYHVNCENKGKNNIISDDDINLTFWKRKQKDWPVLPTIGKSGFTLEIGPLPWGSAVGSLYLKSQKAIWQILDAVEARNRVIERNSKNSGAEDEEFVVVSSPITFFQAANCDPVPYPMSSNEKDEQGFPKLEAIIHPDLQHNDYNQKLTEKTKTFIGLDGVREYTFDKTMLAQEDEEILNKKDFYPYFINESAYYEKRIAFCLSYKITKEVNFSMKKLGL